MKKYLVIMIFAVAAFGFTGCSNDDNTKADLRWNNASGDNLASISWTANGSSDQTWSSVNTSTQSDYKGIHELAGTGDAVIDASSGGGTAVLQLSAGDGVSYVSGSAATIVENAAATLNIDSAK